MPPEVTARPGSRTTSRGERLPKPQVFAQASAWAKPLLGTPWSAMMGVRTGLVVAIAVIVAPRIGYAVEESVVARVNGVPITLVHVNRALDERVPRITGHGTISEARREALRSQVVQELIQEELMVQEAKRQKMTVRAADIDAEMAKIRKRFADQAQYRLALSRAGLSEADVRRGIERYLLVNAIVEKEVTDKVTVTDASMRAYYDEDPSRFVVPEQVQYRQILIAVDPGGTPAQWDTAKRRAAELGKQVRRGTSFSELAVAQSDDKATRPEGGDMGWVHRGQLEHDQEAEIFALPPGGISAPVRTLYGYAIYFVEAKKPSRALSWEEVNKARLGDELRRAEIDERRSAWIADLRRRAVVEISSPEP